MTVADLWIAQSLPGMFTPRHVVDLPDDEHVHVTRRADGSIASIVPMRRYHLDGCETEWENPHCDCPEVLWVDA